MSVSDIETLVSELRKRYIKAFSNHFEQADGKPFYRTDLIMFGVMDRNIGLLEAMPPLFQDKNVHALAPLIRVQLDGLLRLFAFALVEDQDKLAAHLLEGKHLRNFRSVSGEKLTDRFLKEAMAPNFPWVPRVYDNLSGWIHLSFEHIRMATVIDDEKSQITVGIGSYRQHLPDSLFEEMVAAIEEIHKQTISLIESYFGSK